MFELLCRIEMIFPVRQNGGIDRDVIGIDLGITMLGVENGRSDSSGGGFTKNPEID